jgi:hypothetical protein
MAPPDLSLYVGRFEAPGRSSPRATRSHSISSDRPSLSGYGGLLSPPVLISPEPAFIAASAASQIVTNDHDSQSDTWFDQHGIEPSGETALVSPPALKLVNRFLDQLLFNFLSISRSTSLASLRPAVGEVLKPKLAKDAINGADQELHEYLGGGDDDELLAFHNGVEPSGDWDLELVWKRTRLRCMVYSSLGDMEEEDEDFYTEQEQLDGPPGSNNRFSNNPGVVSPAVAIFLTSILEFMGEQVLVVAGQASYYRLRAKHEKEERDGSSTTADIADRVVVEESDMERVALDRTMGRLWRGWKKRIRSPTASISMARSFSRESMRSLPQTSRAASIAPGDFNIEGDSAGQSLATVLAEHDHAASIPLPLSADDVREIEIPGLAKQSDDEMDDASEEEDIRPPPRPKSMLIFTTHTSEDLPQPHTPVFAPKSRKRSHSVPSPVPTPYTSSSKCSTPSDEMAGEDQHVTPEMEHVEEGESGEKPAATTEEVSEKGVEGETTKNPDHNKGTLARAIAGATAFGAAAVSGIIAAANGGAPQTELGVKDETDGEEEFTEEPQILTSSRVSIGGRISPDDPKAPSRQSSVRSPSVHSLRLIDVAPQKSPARSRHGSVDAADYISAGGRPVLSRSNSMQFPILLESQNPRVGSPIQRGPNASPLARNGSPLSQRHTTNSAGESISEVEEKEINDSDSAPMTAVPSDLAAAMQGVDVDPSPTSQTPINRDPPSQRSAFVLAAAPSPRNRDNTSVPVNKSHISQLGSNLPVGSKALGVENGIPPLTPLREMMEGAPDASDEASSITPSYDAHSLSEHAIDSHSPSVSASTLAHSQRATEPGKLARPPTANIPRSSPPRSSRDESSRKVAPEPMARAQRPIHTSGSGSSTSTHKLKPVWTSEENGPTAVEDTSQSFEQLMRSDQTIQYTLTPPNMRNIEVCSLFTAGSRIFSLMSLLFRARTLPTLPALPALSAFPAMLLL